MRVLMNPGRMLHIAAVCLTAAFALPAVVIATGLYYSGANEVVPRIVDNIQHGMMILAGLCGLASVVMLVWFTVLQVRRHWTKRERV